MGQLCACLRTRNTHEIRTVETDGVVTTLRPTEGFQTSKPRGVQYIGPQAVEYRPRVRQVETPMTMIIR